MNVQVTIVMKIDTSKAALSPNQSEMELVKEALSRDFTIQNTQGKELNGISIKPYPVTLQIQQLEA